MASLEACLGSAGADGRYLRRRNDLIFVREVANLLFPANPLNGYAGHVHT